MLMLPFSHCFNALNEDELVHISNFTSEFLACLFLLDIPQLECNLRIEEVESR